jgi:hypothetical protein
MSDRPNPNYRNLGSIVSVSRQCLSPPKRRRAITPDRRVGGPDAAVVAKDGRVREQTAEGD